MFRVKRGSESALQRVVHIIRFETLRRRLASAKSLAKSLAESLIKTLAETLRHYMHGSPQDSLRESFFYAGGSEFFPVSMIR